MIESEVKKIADEFTNFWNEIFNEHPEFELDYTWPSIGIVDKIIFPLRNKKDFSKHDEPLIQGVSAYLACIAIECWKQYPEVQARAYLSLEESKDVIIEAKGGEFLEKDEKFSICLTQVVKTVLKNASKQTKTFEEQIRFITSNDNLLSPVCTGIIPGLSPHGAGAWREQTKKSFNNYLIISAKTLANSCIKFKEKHFAGEEIGSDFNVYFPNLLLPPMQFDEPQPCARACMSLVMYSKQNKISNEQFERLTGNLALFHDELISSTGFALSAALVQNNEAPNWLKSYALSHEMRVILLKPSIDLARKGLGQKSFFELFEISEYIQANLQLKIEYGIGLTPLLYLEDYEILSDPLLEEFCYHLHWTALQECFDALKKYLKINSNIELKLQFIFLGIKLGLIDEMTIELSRLEHENIESQANIFRINELNSLILDYQGEYAKALELQEKCLTLKTKDERRFAIVATKVAEKYIVEKKFKEATNILHSIIDSTPYWTPARLLLLASLSQSKDKQVLKTSLLESKKECHFSNQLFSFFKAYNLQEKLS